MNLSDDELDKLFKDASDKLEGTGAKPDWDGMRSLLDQHLPEKTNQKKRVLLVIFSVIVPNIRWYAYLFQSDITGKNKK